jgi:hypothetical protein
MLQTKVVEEIKTGILCSITFFENVDVYVIIWKNIVEPDRPQMAIWHWIPRAANRHSECVILIAFPLQRWLYERALLLRLWSVACLVATMNYLIFSNVDLTIKEMCRC